VYQNDFCLFLEQSHPCGTIKELYIKAGDPLYTIFCSVQWFHVENVDGNICYLVDTDEIEVNFLVIDFE
jgi:hypothetical protein